LLQVAYAVRSVEQHVSQLQWESITTPEKWRLGDGNNTPEKELPDRLITLKEAADLYPKEVKYADVLRWHYSGRLKEKGRRWLARPGGRSIPLVSQAELAYLKDNRPPIGKHISKEKSQRKRSVAFERRPAQQAQERQAAESSKPLITLAEASQASGIKLSTLYNYLHEGKLTERGRDPYPAPGRGKVLVDPDEVSSLPRRSRGRPKKVPTE
jgi:hypothetical protein